MNLPADIHEKIEQYLNGQLQGQELTDFEALLNSNKELEQEVDFQRELQLFLAESPENELRKKGKTENKSFFRISHR